MRSIIRNLILKVLDKFNVEVVRKGTFYRTAIVDLRNTPRPITLEEVLSFNSKENVDFIINMPVNKIKYSKILDVWIKVLALYKEDDKKEDILNRQSYKYLQNYFLTFQPQNVAERIGIDLSHISKDKETYFLSHPLHYVAPFDNRLPVAKYNSERKIMKEEFPLGGGKNYRKNDGYKSFGPASERLIMSEYNRLINVYNSIKEYGYKEEYGLLKMTALYCKNEEYYYMTGSGWHRTAVVVALGFKTLPVLVSNKTTKIIKEEEIDL